MHGIAGEQQLGHGVGGEVLGTFEHGWSGTATFGWTTADEQAGHIALDEMLVEFGEQLGEACDGPTLVVREGVDEVVDDDETGIDALDSTEEAGEVFR
jgi:hypothetical protein